MFLLNIRTIVNSALWLLRTFVSWLLTTYSNCSAHLSCQTVENLTNVEVSLWIMDWFKKYGSTACVQQHCDNLLGLIWSIIDVERTFVLTWLSWRLELLVVTWSGNAIKRTANSDFLSALSDSAPHTSPSLSGETSWLHSSTSWTHPKTSWLYQDNSTTDQDILTTLLDW